jgi:membrane-bound lytic murein transglycosylase D
MHRFKSLLIFNKGNRLTIFTWRYISSKHTLKVRSQKDLYWHIKWFKENPDYLERVTKRAGAYLHLVVQEVEKAGLPIEVAARVD